LENFNIKFFIKDSIFNILIGGLIIFFGFFLNWAYIDSLGINDYGILVASNSFSAVLLVVLSINNQSLFSRLIPEIKDRDIEKINVFTFFVLQIFHIIFIGFLLFLINSFSPNLISRQLKNFSLYIFFIAALNSLGAIPLGFFLAKNSFKKYRFFSGIGIVILVLLVTFFILNRKTSLNTIFNIQLTSAFVVALFSFLFIYNNSKPKIDFGILIIGLKYSLPIFIYALFSLLSDFYIKINLEKDFESSVLGRYNIILLISSLPIIFATAINSIFIQKILANNNLYKRKNIINIMSRLILVLVFLCSFILISFQELFFSIFSIDSNELNTSLLYLLLTINCFINFCWLLISNELTIHKLTSGFYFTSVLSFLLTCFSYDFFTSYFSILGAAISLILSNLFIFGFLYFYIRSKIKIEIDFLPIVISFIYFLIFVSLFYYLNNIYFINNYIIKVLFNILIFIFSVQYVFKLKKIYL